MKNKLLLTFLGIMILMNVNAQNAPVWTQTINVAPDPDYLFPVKTKVDIFGNVVTMSIQSDPFVLDQKIYLRKFNTDGNILWTQVFDNNGAGSPRGYDLAVDSSANVYVAGGLMANDIPLLMKFNSSGNMVWQRDSTTAFSIGAFNQMILKNGLLYLQGNSGVAVFDIYGNEQWSNTDGSVYIAVDNLGRMVSSSYVSNNMIKRYNTDGTVDFQDTTIMASNIAVDYLNNIYLINNYGAYDIVKYDSSGNFAWKNEAIAVCPPFGDIGVELVIDWNLDLIAVGLNDTIYKFDPNGFMKWKRSMNGLDSYRISTSLFNENYILIAGSKQDSLESNTRIATFDALGNQNWYGDYNSNPVQEFPVAMTFDDSGIYVLIDSVSSTSLLKFEFPVSFGQPVDFTAVCVDSVWYDTLNPAFINVRVFNGSFVHMNYPSVQIVNPSGDTISNKFSQVNFFAQAANSLLVYTDSINEQGITDFSQYRFLMSEGFNDTTVEIYWCLTSDISMIDDKHIGFYPNPSGDVIHLMQLPEGENGMLQIFDSGGSLCLTTDVSEKNMTIHLEKLSPGMYFMRLISKSGLRTGKVVKQ